MRASTRTGRWALAAVCLAAVAVPLAACGASRTPTPAPTVTVTITLAATPPASSPPPPTATATPGPRQCSTSDLRLTVGQSNGAAGTVYYPLDFTNTSGSPCTMYGYPGVAFVTSPGGSVIGVPAGRRSAIPPALVTVAPGATAHATLAVSDVLIGNNCRNHQVPVKWLQVYPPNQYTALFAKLSRQGCAGRSLVTMFIDTVTSGA